MLQFQRDLLQQCFPRPPVAGGFQPHPPLSLFLRFFLKLILGLQAGRHQGQRAADALYDPISGELNFKAFEEVAESP
jgi:hypothetical protein